ncbi:MAG: thermonuclease family protein [Bacillota bacterium]
MKTSRKSNYGNILTRIITLFISVLLITTPFVSAAYNSESWPVPPNLREYTVTRVIDGDTIELEQLGKVRYIGVNTPELHHPIKGVEPYGFEAAIANKKLVLGKKVKLEYDVGRRDKYGRILAYVYVGSIFVNAYLVQAGFAQIMTIPPNVKYATLFRQLQREAQAANRGLWGKVEPVKQSGLYLGSAKGSTYHYQTCKWAQKIKPGNKIWFNSKDEAEKSGYKPCKACNP